MKQSVTKEFKFEAAHRLINYQGKCKNIHGHSWVVFVEVIGEGLDEVGMIYDFGDFAPLKVWIDKHLDHATIVNHQDVELLGFLLEHDQKRFIVNQNPTSEVLCAVIFNEAMRLLALPEGAKVNSVRIKETCTSEACYALK